MSISLLPNRDNLTLAKPGQQKKLLDFWSCTFAASSLSLLTASVILAVVSFRSLNIAYYPNVEVIRADLSTMAPSRATPVIWVEAVEADEPLSSGREEPKSSRD